MSKKADLSDHWWASEDMLFRLLETVGRVRSNEDFKKSSTFTRSIRQWLQKQRRPKDVLYILNDRAQDYGINVHAVNGWLDTFSGLQIQSTSTENASTL